MMKLYNDTMHQIIIDLWLILLSIIIIKYFYLNITEVVCVNMG